jgi:hypothetical protein
MGWKMMPKRKKCDKCKEIKFLDEIHWVDVLYSNTNKFGIERIEKKSIKYCTKCIANVMADDWMKGRERELQRKKTNDR